MNKIFACLMSATMAFLLFTNPNSVLKAMIAGSEKAVDLCIILLAVYAVWLSVLELVSATKLDIKLAKLLSPLSQKLFGRQNEEVEKQIAINLSSNMLGMSNASTPSGIKAMEGLDKKTGKITKAMAMLMIINTTAIQIIPTTIIGLRTSFNSSAPTSIFFTTLIATSASTLVGILLVLLIEKLKTKKGTKKL
jgi:spore maturation protein A